MGCCAGTQSKTYANAGQNNAELKAVLSTIQNDLILICFTSSLIRQLHHFASDFDRVLLQLVGTDIVNILFKYTASYRHVTFMIDTFELLLKSCAKCDLLIVNIQCATACSLEKVNLKV